MKNQAQVSMELIAVLGFVIFLFGIIYLEVLSRNVTANELIDNMRKRVVCQEIAQAITDTHQLGARASMELNLSYRYNISVIGTHGYVSVGVAEDGVSCEQGCIYDGVVCRFPQGIAAGNPTFTDQQQALTLTNNNGTVVIRVE
jgi:hypothetical protein